MRFRSDTAVQLKGEKMDTIKNGSRASSPDMDWSQVRETVLMLELGAVQIDTALRDGNSSFAVLSQAFVQMADLLAEQKAVLHDLPIMPEGEATKARMLASSESMQAMMDQAIVSFQFYDRLGQRLDHVCHSLHALSELVADRRKIFSPDEWVALQQKIRSRYTTPEEHAMFDAVMAGMPVEQAIAKFIDELQGKAGGEIEFF